MKKIGILIALITFMTASSTARAEIKEDSFSVTPFVGGTLFEGNQDLREALVYGLRGGYNFTKHLGVEGFFSYTKTEINTDAILFSVGYVNTGGDPWQDIWSYGIEGLYHFMPEGRFVPFISIGLGGIHYGEGRIYSAKYDPEYGERFEANKIAVDYGAGLKYFLTDNIALRADVRHILPLGDKWNNPHHVHNDLSATFGITFALGGGKKEEPPPKEEIKVEEKPAPVDMNGDSDGDGVPNDLDKCPRSPAGAVVDKDGCLPDSDEDGVLDYEDHCKNTPKGAKVDKDGCPADTDFDGVSDYQDECSNTPRGTLVGKDGCASKKTSIVLKVQFDSNKSFINKKYHADIKKVAQFMKTHPQATATIAGHSDSSGDRKSNILLSDARAKSVRKYLIEKFGIKGSRITAIGYGPDKPIASNATKEGRKKNRRIVALFETVQKK